MIHLKAFLLFLAPITLIGQTWSDRSDLSSLFERHHPVTFSIGGVGYLMGGGNSSNETFKDFHSYDPVTDTWTSKSDFPGLSRGYSYGVSSDTKGYVGFGLHIDGGGGFNYLFDLWEYDPVSDSWTELASFPGSARVHPAMVPLDAPIASVEGVLNAVECESDFAGTTMLEGRGAGAGPTASAVVGDLVDIAVGRMTPVYGVPVSALATLLCRRGPTRRAPA